MPNAAVRANARTLPEATTRRAALGTILAVGAIGVVPIAAGAATASLDGPWTSVSPAFAKAVYRAAVSVRLLPAIKGCSGTRCGRRPKNRREPC
jgi:hypothetical protein